MDENKKLNVFKKWWFYLILIIIISIAYFVFNMLNRPEFKIESFNMDSEKNEYEYIENSISYTGEGDVVCTDTKNPYIVIVKVKRLSGGNKEKDEEQIQQVIVTKGKGTIMTYDYGNEKEVTKPKYSFEIKGYIKLNKLDILFKS